MTGAVVYSTELEAAPLDLNRSSSLPIDPGDTVVLTGGGSGITAELGIEIARRYGASIGAIGRTPWPATYPYPEAHSEDALTAAVRADMPRLPGDGADPLFFQKRLALIKRQRELLETKRRVDALGSRFTYHSADATNPRQLKRAFEAIERDLGVIRGFVHGAGVFEKRRIERKDRARFIEVISSKAVSLHHCQQLLDRQPLSFAVVLSSISAATGSAELADYVAANEVANRMAHRWNEQAAYPVRALLYSAWTEAGMVPATSRELMTRQGIPGFSNTLGVEHFINELERGREDESWVLLTHPRTLQFVEQTNRGTWDFAREQNDI